MSHHIGLRTFIQFLILHKLLVLVQTCGTQHHFPFSIIVVCVDGADNRKESTVPC